MKKYAAITQEKRIELLTQIACALLASGHYTGVDEDTGEPYPKGETVFDAVFDAEHIFEEIQDQIAYEEDIEPL